MQNLYALITAAGQGTRLGKQGPKALVEICGRTLFEWALLSVLQAFPFKVITVTTPAGTEELFADLAQRLTKEARAKSLENTCEKTLGKTLLVLPADWPLPQILFVSGGESRQESVFNGLKFLRNNQSCLKESSPEYLTSDHFILVHDAARPFTPPEVFHRVITALQSGAKAVTPVLPSADTIKTVTAPDSAMPGAPQGIEQVEKTLPRDTLRRVQTPQGFQWETLWQLHLNCAAEITDTETSTQTAIATDDCTMAENAHIKTYCVPGDEKAFKITTPWDLKLAKAIFHF